jgi:hypothetical protein
MLDQQSQINDKGKKIEGRWYMSFDQWHEYYNKLYLIKVFPESWENYSIDSFWEGKTFGGRIFNISNFSISSMPRKRYGVRKIRYGRKE